MSGVFVGPAQRRRIENARQPLSDSPTLWEYVAPAPGSYLEEQLVEIAREMLRTAEHGVILGEVISEAESRGIDCSSPPKADKQKEQRGNSWFARIMPATGAVASKTEMRRSPVRRHHGSPHVVYRLRGAE